MNATRNRGAEGATTTMASRMGALGKGFVLLAIVTVLLPPAPAQAGLLDLGGLIKGTPGKILRTAEKPADDGLSALGQLFASGKAQPTPAPTPDDEQMSPCPLNQKLCVTSTPGAR